MTTPSDKPEAAAWRSFNLNGKVRVKLSQRGLDVLKAKHDALYAWSQSVKGPLPPWEPPTLKDGWYETQLWCLMHDFGDETSMGCDPCFETTIELAATVPELQRSALNPEAAWPFPKKAAPQESPSKDGSGIAAPAPMPAGAAPHFKSYMKTMGSFVADGSERYYHAQEVDAYFRSTSGSIPREATPEMMEAAAQTPGIKCLDGWATEMQVARGRNATWDQRDPPLAQAWRAMWDVATRSAKQERTDD